MFLLHEEQLLVWLSAEKDSSGEAWHTLTPSSCSALHHSVLKLRRLLWFLLLLEHKQPPAEKQEAELRVKGMEGPEVLPRLAIIRCTVFSSPNQ